MIPNHPTSLNTALPETSSARDPLFDVVKALMMLWVVWGHFSRWGVVAGPLEPAPFMGNLKIGVNMPIFFLIGGYLSFSTFQKGSWAKILARTIGFLWPMAAFGLFFALVLTAMRGWNGLRWFVYFPVKQVLHEHWFLRTYAGVYLLSAMVYRMCRNDKCRCLVFVLLYTALLFWPARFRSCLDWVGGSPTIHMLPYFVFGLLVFRKYPAWRFSRIALPCVAFILAVILLEGQSFAKLMNFWNVSMHWRSVFLDRWNLLAFFGRTAVGLAGSVAVLYGVDRLLRCFPQLSTFAVFGTTTLGVYVLHEWPLIQIGKSGLPCLPLPFWTRFPLAVAWFLLCHVIISDIRRISTMRFVFFGDEYRLSYLLEHAIEGGKRMVATLSRNKP